MDHFPDVQKIPFEGPKSRHPLAYRYYNADEVVEGKTLREHLRFSVCYWHTFRATGADPFVRRPCCGRGTTAARRSTTQKGAWMPRLNSCQTRWPLFTAFTIGTWRRTVRPSPRPTTISMRSFPSPESGPRRATGIKLLWGTANLFSHPRYLHGAATSPNAEVSLRGRPGQKGDRSHARTGRERTTFSGAGAKAIPTSTTRI